MTKLCKVCQSSAFKEVLSFNGCNFSDGTQGKGDLKKEECQACGTVRTNLMTSLKEFYRNNYKPSRNIDTIAFNQNQEVMRSQFIYNWIEDLISSSTIQSFDSVLEIGCGQGMLLEKFQVKNKYGVEPSKKAAIEASKRAKVRNIFFEEVSDEEKYDLVISYCVIEHVEDPRKFIKKNYKILGEDGVMCIALPIQDKFNYDLVFADHIHHFSHDNFVKLINNCGFDIVNYELGRGAYFNIAMYICKKMKVEGQKDYTYVYNQNINNIKKIFAKIDLISKREKKHNMYAFGYGEIAKTIVPYTNLDESIIKYIDDYTVSDRVIASKESMEIFKRNNKVELILLVNPIHMQKIQDIYKDFSNITFINIFENVKVEF